MSETKNVIWTNRVFITSINSRTFYRLLIRFDVRDKNILAHSEIVPCRRT